MKAPPILDDATIIATWVLREGVKRSHRFDMRCDRTFAALTHLEHALPGTQSVQQFRRALEFEDQATCWHECKDALFSIEISVAAVLGGLLPPKKR